MHCNCDKDKYTQEFLDINGVKVIFQVMKDNLSMSKNELLDVIKKNTDKLNSKINCIDEELSSVKHRVKKNEKNISTLAEYICKIKQGIKDITGNYYTKIEVDEKISEVQTKEISEQEINDSFETNTIK